MKLVIVKGSYHKKGNIAHLVDDVIRGFKDINPKAQVETIDLLDTNIEFCCGCKKCGEDNNEKIGKCIKKDDMEQILEKLLKADRVVFASPIYCYSITAIMKRFLERSIPMVIYPKNHWPKVRNETIKGKKGYIILSTDCSYPMNWLFGITTSASKVLKKFLKLFGCDKISTLHASTQKLQAEKFKKKAYNIGKYLGK